MSVGPSNDAPLISRVPARYLRTGGTLTVEEAWKVYSAGSVPVSILSFFPELKSVERWVAKWVQKVLPSGIKARLMQRDLLRLSKLYSGLSDEDRKGLSVLVDTDKVMDRIYDAASLSFPRNIRHLAHIVLDQVIWCHSQEKGKRINAVLYPRDETAMEFQFSRLDYVLTTLGPSEAVEKLNAGGQMWSTVRLILDNLNNPHFTKSFPLMDQLSSIVECLPPAESLRLMAIYYQLPSRVRRTLFQHLYTELTLISKPKRLQKVVSQTIGDMWFTWYILEPQCCLTNYMEWEDDDLAVMKRLSSKMFKHLQDIDYSYLKRSSGRRLVRYHPSNGASLITFMDYLLVNDRIGDLQDVIQRLTRTAEMASELMVALSNPQHRDHSKATFLITRLPRLQHLIGHVVLPLRVLGSDPVLDEDVYLAIFEHLHNALRDVSVGLTPSTLCANVVESIGYERFMEIMLGPRNQVETGKEDQSTVIHGCIEDFAERILLSIAEEGPIGFVKALHKSSTNSKKYLSVTRQCEKRFALHPDSASRNLGSLLKLP